MSAYDPQVPYRGKRRTEDIDRAIARVLDLHNQRQALRSELAVAIRTAQDKGANLRELAALLNVSPTTVRTMSQADQHPAD